MKTFQDSEIMEHTYTGTYQIKNGKKYLMYNDGFENCLLTSDGEIVNLRRYKSGTVMIFEKNAQHVTSYITPMGTMPLSVVTQDISDKLAYREELSVRYSLSIGETSPVENKINITIEEI